MTNFITIGHTPASNGQISRRGWRWPPLTGRGALTMRWLIKRRLQDERRMSPSAIAAVRSSWRLYRHRYAEYQQIEAVSITYWA